MNALTSARLAYPADAAFAGALAAERPGASASANVTTTTATAAARRFTSRDGTGESAGTRMVSLVRTRTFGGCRQHPRPSPAPPMPLALVRPLPVALDAEAPEHA